MRSGNLELNPTPSPFSKAPFDVLAEIFSACDTPHAYLDEYGLVYNYSNPAIPNHFCKVFNAWTLSYVCQYWRDLALSSPCLWSSIIVRDQQIKTAKGIKHLLALVLERNKDAPLTIDTTCRRRPAGNYEYPKERLDDIVDILSPHLSRAQTLAFNLNLDSPLSTFLSRSSEFPYLPLGSRPSLAQAADIS